MAALRIERGLTQSAVADVCAISYAHASAIEGGAQMPSIALAQRIANRLNCTVGYLIGETEYVNTPYFGALNDLINLLDDRDREILTMLARLMLKR